MAQPKEGRRLQQTSKHLRLHCEDTILTEANLGDGRTVWIKAPQILASAVSGCQLCGILIEAMEKYSIPKDAPVYLGVQRYPLGIELTDPSLGYARISATVFACGGM
jgi:hypothetical protein